MAKVEKPIAQRVVVERRERVLPSNIKEIKSKHFSFEIVGDGEKVISQLPKYKEKIKEGSKVVLFT